MTNHHHNTARNEGYDTESVLVLRTCNPNMTSHGGFVWPTEGPVEAPDWNPTAECGNGLHGLAWGVAEVGGPAGLEPNVPYQLNNAGEFVKADDQ